MRGNVKSFIGKLRLTRWSSIGNAEKDTDIFRKEWISRINIVTCSSYISILCMSINLYREHFKKARFREIHIPTWKIGGGPKMNGLKRFWFWISKRRSSNTCWLLESTRKWIRNKLRRNITLSTVLRSMWWQMLNNSTHEKKRIRKNVVNSSHLSAIDIWWTCAARLWLVRCNSIDWTTVNHTVQVGW